MALFKTQEEKALRQEIIDLRVEISKLIAHRDATKEEFKLSDRVKALKERISDLEIEKSKLDEDHEREKREVEHAVGLKRKELDADKQQAINEAKLSVREENLSNSKEQFEKEMEFTRKRLEQEIDGMRDLVSQVLDRLPTVTVDRKIREDDRALPAGGTEKKPSGGRSKK